MRGITILIAAFLYLQIQAQKKDQYENGIFTCIVPVAATFPGGITALHNFIFNHFIQPDAVPDSSFTKKGSIRFTIEKNGTVAGFEIVDTLGYQCDEEIIRILQLTKWKPAVYEGIKIEDHHCLPYTISFEGSEKTKQDTSPQSAPACPPQTLLAKYVL